MGKSKRIRIIVKRFEFSIIFSFIHFMWFFKFNFHITIDLSKLKCERQRDFTNVMYNMNASDRPTFLTVQRT